MEDVQKADPRPTTEQWYQTVLKIKEFCESHEMQLNDTQYGWLATFFYELVKEDYVVKG